MHVPAPAGRLRSVLAAFVIAAAAVGGLPRLAPTFAVAEPADAAAKSAFETAKELGTVDAWNAFLKAYPAGFHADMARAYLKKLGEQPQADTPAPPAAASSARATERRCSQSKSLKSKSSAEPTKITFINNSGMYRAILWIDFNGDPQSYGGLNPGEQQTFETFRSHPWMIATGPGDCLQIFLPAAEPATIELLRMPADDGRR